MVNAGVTFSLMRDAELEARKLGFVAFGVASAATDSSRAERLETWLDEGMHGAMGWMEQRRHHRRSPQGLWPDAKSVICLGMSYAPALSPLALEAHPEHARISAYAQGKDYHDIIKKALKALARWLVAEAPKRGIGDIQVKVFTDTAPVMEKPLAEEAALGWQGKHTNLVSRENGSWLLLGEIYTSLEVSVKGPETDHCGSCNACQDACPTAAFPAPYQLDARRCISYLTIENKGPIPLEFRKPMGNRIYGCDDCLAVCPWNKFADMAHTHRAFLPRAELAAPELADLLTLDDAGFRTLFSGSPIKRIGRNSFVRNCLIAAGNSGSAALKSQVARLTSDLDPVVSEAADWALAELTAIP